MESVSSRLAHFPVSFFSTVMGMAGFTIVMLKVESIYHLESRISLIFLSITMLLFVLLLLTYALKLWKEKTSVIEELHHPVKLSFFPTISISLILLSIALLHLNTELARGFWILGSSLHIIFTLYIMNAWIHHDHFNINHMNPAWFIPVVGNILVPIAGVSLGYTDISWFFLV